MFLLIYAYASTSPPSTSLPGRMIDQIGEERRGLSLVPTCESPLESEERMTRGFHASCKRRAADSPRGRGWLSEKRARDKQLRHPSHSRPPFSPVRPFKRCIGGGEVGGEGGSPHRRLYEQSGGEDEGDVMKTSPTIDPSLNEGNARVQLFRLRENADRRRGVRGDVSAILLRLPLLLVPN